MNIECPQCESNEFTKLSLVYAQGFSDLEARSRGWGLIFRADGPDIAFGKAKTKGEIQTRLSQRARPPRKKPYRQVVLAWFLGILIGGWLFGYLDFITHHPDAVFKAQFTWFAYIYSGLIAFVLAVLWRFNRKIFPLRHRLWERSFMCQRCGHIFQLPQPNDAARSKFAEEEQP